MTLETTLVFGGARSGKSRFAEKLVLDTGLIPVYLATGRAMDEEMQERIAEHQERRGENWTTIEEPLAVFDALRQESRAGRVMLVDCITLWITNLMMAEANVIRECETLCDYLRETTVPTVVVSNETGLGVVPENAMAREFNDLAGRVNQMLAEACSNVFLVAAGLPLTLKQAS